MNTSTDIYSENTQENKFTFVVSFATGKEPAVGFDTEILGGRLSFVAFEDIRKYFLEQDEARAIESLVDEHRAAFDEWCEEHNVNPDDLAEKIRQQTL